MLTADTIAAIATAPGGGARAIVRISGPNVAEILSGCFRPHGKPTLASAGLPGVVPGEVLLPAGPIRELPADLYFWPTSRSYTRAPLAELHTLGSPPLVAALLAAVCEAGARLAEPGEFTLRAFLAGRIDLVQAEAVLGVIDARNQRELSDSLARLAGGLSAPLMELRETLLELLAHVEAGLDFVEDDIQFVAASEIQRQLDDAIARVQRASAQLSTRQRRDTLPRVALIGWPNVGKSSLFNALATDRQALVADAAGTTRDFLTAVLDLEGVRCELVDTAGLEAPDPQPDTPCDGAIAGAAQSFALRQAATCDLALVCFDGARPLLAGERDLIAASPAQSRMVVLTKADQPRATDYVGKVIETSAATGQGLDALRSAVRRSIVEQVEAAPAAAADFCRDSLRTAGAALSRAAEANRAGAGEELIAGEVRVALTELGRVVGAVYTDDILDRIFSRFCIGK